MQGSANLGETDSAGAQALSLAVLYLESCNIPSYTDLSVVKKLKNVKQSTSKLASSQGRDVHNTCDRVTQTVSPLKCQINQSRL